MALEDYTLRKTIKELKEHPINSSFRCRRCGKKVNATLNGLCANCCLK